MPDLSEAGKEELALALVLWKDFKAGGKFDLEVLKQMLSLADHLGVREQTEIVLSRLPPMQIRER